MAITLLVRSGGAQGSTPAQSGITFDLPRIVLGRGDGCDVRLPDVSVSHRHASIRQRGSEYIVVDEGSTNGTYVGAVRLHSQSPRVIRNGEMIRLGRVWIEIRIEHIAATAQPAQATRELALALVARALDAQGETARPRLVGIEGPDEGKELDLSEPMRPYVLGRGRDVDLPIDVSDASRRHAQVVRRGDTLLVRDLGSKNGTHIEAGPVPVDRDATLRVGDVLRIGPDAFVFEFGAIEALKELEHASDEPLDASQPVEPPDPPPGDTPPPPSAPAPKVDEIFPDPNEPQDEAPPPAAIARSHRSKQKKGGGWSRTDVAVGLLALVVLGLSAIGLVWLFRGG
ncbi:MAG: FHA domain-containing protein [Deltaproteobacteria bacterium]|nr:FHA domain-containing protein [Deltaproteobacteria bacterium]